MMNSVSKLDITTFPISTFFTFNGININQRYILTHDKIKTRSSVDNFSLKNIECQPQYVETLILVRMISLIFGFPNMIYKAILAELVTHITVKIGPHYFLTNRTSTHIFLTFATFIFCLRKII